jgi:hypothetical protein
VVLFDEFSDLRHEFAAWQEFNQAFKAKWRPLAARRNLSRIAFKMEAMPS